MQTQLLDYKQVFFYVQQLTEKEKEKLFFSLKEERFKTLLASLRKSVGVIPLSFEEITKEVEAVRKRRYESKSKK